jgi:hypothetical protein
MISINKKAVLHQDNLTPYQNYINTHETPDFNERTSFVSYTNESTGSVFSSTLEVHLNNLSEAKFYKPDYKKDVEIFKHACSIEKLETLHKIHPKDEDIKLALFSSIDAKNALVAERKYYYNIKKEYRENNPTKALQKLHYYDILVDNLTISEVLARINILEKRINDLTKGTEYYHTKDKINSVPHNVEKINTKKLTSREKLINRLIEVYSIPDKDYGLVCLSQNLVEWVNYNDYKEYDEYYDKEDAFGFVDSDLTPIYVPDYSVEDIKYYEVEDTDLTPEKPTFNNGSKYEQEYCETYLNKSIEKLEKDALIVIEKVKKEEKKGDKWRLQDILRKMIEDLDKLEKTYLAEEYVYKMDMHNKINGLYYKLYNGSRY